MGFSLEESFLFLYYFNFDKQKLTENLFEMIDKVKKETKIDLWKTNDFGLDKS